MNILVTNDDGIASSGIYALAAALRRLGTVTVVAPDRQQSAVGHALTVSEPLRVTRIWRDGQFFGYAVSGTPADCVKLAIARLLESPAGHCRLRHQPRLQHGDQRPLLGNGFCGNRSNAAGYSSNSCFAWLIR